MDFKISEYTRVTIVLGRNKENEDEENIYVKSMKKSKF